MKRGVPEDELPFIHNTNVQLEYRFPLCIDLFLIPPVARILGNLFNVTGMTHILLNPPTRVYGRLVGQLNIDYVKPRSRAGVPLYDIDILDEVTRSYDFIHTDITGWTDDHFRICQKNRCLIRMLNNSLWSAQSNEWLTATPFGAQRMKLMDTPTRLIEEHEALRCGYAMVSPYVEDPELGSASHPVFV